MYTYNNTYIKYHSPTYSNKARRSGISEFATLNQPMLFSNPLAKLQCHTNHMLITPYVYFNVHVESHVLSQSVFKSLFPKSTPLPLCKIITVRHAMS